MTEKNQVTGGTLYLVATPIGNLADLSPRALKVLREVDLIAAEDTRTSARLLAAYGIEGRSMLPYHEHNRFSAGEEICRRLQAGASVALVTDAGMPAVSDPGEDIVRLCADKGLPVTVIPGCCAAVTALAMSGLPTRRFVFEGFLPMQSRERKERLEALRLERRTAILYAAPHKLRDDLRDLLDAVGDRRLSLCRELTKLNEEVIRTTVAGAAAYYAENEPRGEYVLILEGAAEEAVRADAFFAEMTVPEHVAYYEARGLARMDAIKAVAKDRGVGKNAIYKEMI